VNSPLSFPPNPSIQTHPKALFASWVLEGRGGEGSAYGEVNPCLGVIKKHGKVLGVLKGFICPFLKFP